MRMKSKIEKKCYPSHAFYVDKMSVLKFDSSQGNTVYFLPLKTTSNKLELQQTCIYLIKHLIALLNTITTMATPRGEIDYTLVGGLMVTRRLGILQTSLGLLWHKASYFSVGEETHVTKCQ